MHRKEDWVSGFGLIVLSLVFGLWPLVFGLCPSTVYRLKRIQTEGDQDRIPKTEDQSPKTNTPRPRRLKLETRRHVRMPGILTPAKVLLKGTIDVSKILSTSLHQHYSADFVLLIQSFGAFGPSFCRKEDPADNDLQYPHRRGYG
jgi:hypothetical protein